MAEAVFDVTSAGRRREKTGSTLLIGVLCMVPPTEGLTSSADVDPSEFVRFETTTAGPRLLRSETVVARIRQLSGLTWEQLAQMCGTSRRTLHLWASGRRMQPSNEERLLRILGILQHIDTGSSDENRRQLLEVRADGVRIVDLLAQGLLDEASNAIGLGAELPSSVIDTASKPLPADRRPPTPVDLLEALHDPVHVERGHHPKPRLRRLRRGK